MKKRFLPIALSFAATFWLNGLAPAATITYTYDAQHRLVQASYSASEKVFYNYDAAGNVDQHVTITDAKYLQSWLLYFSMLDAVNPAWLPAPWGTLLRTILDQAGPC